MTYNGWKISDHSREELLARFPTQYPDQVCHHVTSGLRLGCPDPATIRVIGHVARDGVEALVVEVNGAARRLDDSFYHITHSLDRVAGAVPNDSNKIVRDYVAVDPIDGTSVPFWVDSQKVEHMIYTVKEMAEAYAACRAASVKPSRLDESGVPMWRKYISHDRVSS